MATTPRAILDMLLEQCRKDKHSYAEVTLHNGAKLTIGCVFNYQVRYSPVTGQQDIMDLNHSEAYEILNAAPDALEARLDEAREAHPHVPLTAPKRRVSKEMLDKVAEMEVDPLNRKHY